MILSAVSWATGHVSVRKGEKKIHELSGLWLEWVSFRLCADVSLHGYHSCSVSGC